MRVKGKTDLQIKQSEETRAAIDNAILDIIEAGKKPSIAEISRYSGISSKTLNKESNKRYINNHILIKKETSLKSCSNTEEIAELEKKLQSYIKKLKKLKKVIYH